MNTYTSHYRNEYGEEWTFEYNYSNKMVTLRGSDVDWQIYPVINGHPVGLILTRGEEEWLETAWQNAMKEFLNN